MPIAQPATVVRSDVQQDKFLRMSQVCEITGLSVSQIYVLISRQDFAPKIRLSPRCVGFSAKAVQEWVEARKREAEADGGQLFAGGVK